MTEMKVCWIIYVNQKICLWKIKKTVIIFAYEEKGKERVYLKQSCDDASTWKELEDQALECLKTNVTQSGGYEDIILYKASTYNILLFCRKEIVAFSPYDVVLAFRKELQ